MRWSPILAAFAFVMAGCSPDTAARERETSVATLLTEAVPTWRVGTEPVLDIGGDADPAGGLFRVSGAARTGNGIVVVNAGDDEVRLYSEAGRLLSHTGRSGAGPGEFRSPRLLRALDEDSVAIYDGDNNRVSIVCDGGEVCAERSMSGSSGFPIDVDRRWFLRESNRTPLAGGVGGPVQAEHEYWLEPRAGGESVHVATVRGTLYLTGESDGQVFLSPVPFTGRPFAVLRGSEVMVFSGDEPALEVYDSTGAEARRLPLPIRSEPVTDEAYGQAVESLLESVPEPARAGRRRQLLSAPRPATRRPIAAILPDRQGNVRVRLEARDGTPPNAWLQIDSTGATLTTLVLPRRFRPTDFGEDWVLGVWLDSLDVEHVRLYGLERGDPAGPDGR